jgi:tetratricopeptide (TPR) repeat protein
MLLEAWVGERRADPGAAEHAYRRALELAEQAGFLDHAAYAISGLGSTAFATGHVREAEELQRRALATAEASGAPLVAALARVELARVLAAAGDTATAERLYQTVLEWSGTSRSHQARESVFVSIADNPAHAALLGLAELAEARGDAAAADDFRERAGLLPA